MTRPRHERPALVLTDADAWTALLRREQQIDAIQRSTGWRLLSYYGPYKRRFVMPAWRRIRGIVDRWLRSSGDEVVPPYEQWARFSDRLRHAIADPAAADPAHDGGPPAVSVLVTSDGSTHGFLDAAVASVLGQRHASWELRVAFVGASDASLPRIAVDDPRVHVDPKPYPTHGAAGHALVTRAEGTTLALMPPPVVLASDALYAAVQAFGDTEGDILYSDEDLRDERGLRHSPQLKPAWSPDLLLSSFYWSRLVFYRRAVLERMLPVLSELDGAHYYDLALRASEQPTRIVHLPRILAHVRVLPTATGGIATAAEREAGRRVLETALARRGIAGSVSWHQGGDVYRVQRTVTATSKVSIIIPTRDGLGMLQRCLRAVEATDHPSFEIIIVDNGSVEAATLAFLAATPHRVVRAPGPFNFSRLNNLAVTHTDGQQLLFLNNDTEPCGTDWLRALEEHAQRPEVGAVGAKLLYSDGTIQHAGIGVGIGGVAGHPHRFKRQAPEGIRNLSAVTGACLMMRRETFDRVGGFDERLPVNSNDVDLCLRLRALGYLVIYTPHAVLYHYESQSRGRRALPDDMWLMARRWPDVIRADPYYNPNADRSEETGEMDLSKPDGMVCLYGGAGAGEGSLRVAGGASVGQGFFAPGPDLSAVVVQGTIQGEHPERAVRLTIREASQERESVRTVEHSIVGRAHDELWFCFDPILESAGRHWYLELEVRTGYTLTVGRRAVVSDVMGPCFENGAPSYGGLVFQLFARAAYRCAMSPP